MRVAVISDLHCGAWYGLTPPEYHGGEALRIQGAMWKWYAATMEALQPIDLLICNGDAIDGKSDKSGGRELITADRRIQTVIAARCIAEARAKKVLIIEGTGYHTGNDEAWEEVLADRIGADFDRHGTVECGGVRFDVKHHIGGSSIPHGRHTAIARDSLWLDKWADKGVQGKADVLLRGHVHYFGYNGNADRLCMTLPCLQLWTSYGSTRCSGTIDVGLVSFDCADGRYEWKAHLFDMSIGKSEVRRY